MLREEGTGSLRPWVLFSGEELGKEVGVPMRLANLTLEEMTEALNRGWAGRDSRSSMLLQEERSGVEVRASTEDIARILGQ